MKPVLKFSGTPRQCGAAYGQYYQREIAGFFSQEYAAYKYSKAFVRSCLRTMQSEAPQTAAFIRGVATVSLLSEEQHVLLLLHEEELYHRKLMKKTPHCSAVGVVHGSGSRTGVLLGENWDWSTSYFPWSSFNRFRMRNFPRILALSYPGLPVCAGINESGLSLLWTGAGYYPPLCPKVGVPTYALVMETLLHSSVEQASRYLSKVTNAGAFIFLLGDRRGDLVIAEGIPGKIIIRHEQAGHRSNVFEYEESVRAARQRLPSESKCHSLKRNRVFKEQFPRISARPGIAGIKRILEHPTILIEQRFRHATLVQLITDSSRRQLLVREWRQKNNPWVSVKV